MQKQKAFIIFSDMQRFSKMTDEQQFAAIRSYTEALKEVRHVAWNELYNTNGGSAAPCEKDSPSSAESTDPRQSSDEASTPLPPITHIPTGEENEILFLPTGDGCAIIFIEDGDSNPLTQKKWAEKVISYAIKLLVCQCDSQQTAGLVNQTNTEADIKPDSKYPAESHAESCHSGVRKRQDGASGDRVFDGGVSNNRHQYSLRIGIAYGDVITFPDITSQDNVINNATGATVVEAARLMDAADPDQILVNSNFYRLIEAYNLNINKYRKVRLRVKHNHVIEAYQYLFDKNKFFNSRHLNDKGASDLSDAEPAECPSLPESAVVYALGTLYRRSVRVLEDPNCLDYIHFYSNDEPIVNGEFVYIFFHGIGLDASDFETFIRRSKSRCIAINMYGCDSGSPIKKSIPLERHIDYLATAAILILESAFNDKRSNLQHSDNKQTAKVMLVGFSIGADVLLQGVLPRIREKFSTTSALLLDPNVNASTCFISQCLSRISSMGPDQLSELNKIIESSKHINDWVSICVYLAKILAKFKDRWGYINGVATELYRFYSTKTLLHLIESYQEDLPEFKIVFSDSYANAFGRDLLPNISFQSTNIEKYMIAENKKHFDLIEPSYLLSLIEQYVKEIEESEVRRLGANVIIPRYD